MVSEEEGRQHPPLFFHALAAGLHCHAIFARPDAGGGKDPAADIDDAQATDADWAQPRMMADHRNVDAVLTGGLPDGGVGGDGDGTLVDRQMDHGNPAILDIREAVSILSWYLMRVTDSESLSVLEHLIEGWLILEGPD